MPLFLLSLKDRTKSSYLHVVYKLQYVPVVMYPKNHTKAHHFKIPIYNYINREHPDSLKFDYQHKIPDISPQNNQFSER